MGSAESKVGDEPTETPPSSAMDFGTTISISFSALTQAIADKVDSHIRHVNATGALFRVLAAEVQKLNELACPFPQFFAAVNLFGRLQVTAFPGLGARVAAEAERDSLSRYCRYSIAAYGRGLSNPLVYGDVGSFFKTEMNAFCDFSEIPLQDVLFTHTDKNINEQAMYVFLEHSRKEIVVSIRGTLETQDILTDLMCTSVALDTESDELAHEGMLLSAANVVRLIEGTLEHCSRVFPSYSLVFTGHSLGAGVAALSAMLMRDRFPTVRSVGFGTPCVLSLRAAESLSDIVTTVVVGHDIVSRLGLGTMQDLCFASNYIATTSADPAAFFGADGAPNEVACVKLMSTLRGGMTASKLYPPGRVLWVDCHNDAPPIEGARDDSLLQINAETFTELIISSHMISDHLPSRYIHYMSSLTVE